MQFTYKARPFDIEGISPDDHILKTITATGSFYEKDLLEYMHSLIKRSDKRNTLAIDAGANIGNHSIFMRSFLSDHLIAVEPNPSVLPLLRRNLARNIDNYSVYDCALGEVDGTGTMILPEEAGHNMGMARVSVTGDGGTVHVTTLDSIVTNWQQTRNKRCNVSVIKIDVEGMELAVLKGAEETIALHKPHIFVEAATTEDFRKINSYLQSLGYKNLSRWAVTPVFHFSFDPSFLLILRVRRAEMSRSIQRIKRRLIRCITGRIESALSPSGSK